MCDVAVNPDGKSLVMVGTSGRNPRNVLVAIMQTSVAKVRNTMTTENHVHGPLTCESLGGRS